MKYSKFSGLWPPCGGGWWNGPGRVWLILWVVASLWWRLVVWTWMGLVNSLGCGHPVVEAGGTDLSGFG